MHLRTSAVSSVSLFGVDFVLAACLCEVAHWQLSSPLSASRSIYVTMTLSAGYEMVNLSTQSEQLLSSVNSS